ncbi:MAG: hypothetical protein AAF639_09840 [Chloroflexota bacterium]
MTRGVSFYEGQGFRRPVYDFETDVITWTVDGRMELTSVVYAFLMSVGISAYDVPSVVSILGWLMFLTGTGVLAYRLSSSVATTIITLLTTSITWSHLTIFQTAVSEVIFLPILVWTLALFVDYPTTNKRNYSRLILCTVLLAFLMLTRYSGGFLFGGIGLWLLWWRIYQNKFWQSIPEFLTLFCACLPAIAVILYKQRYFLNVVSGNDDAQHTFLVGLVAVIRSCLQLFIPAVHHPSTTKITQGEDLFFFYLVPIYLLLGVGLLYAFWQMRGRIAGVITPPRSPIIILASIYLGLYVLLQPVMIFSPMDFRDSTTLLALLQPWLIFIFTQTMWQIRFAVIYLLFNYLIVLAPVITANFSQGMPDLLSLSPPRIHDLSGQTKKIDTLLAQGVPEWLIIRSPRAKTLPIHHQDLIEYLKRYKSDVVIVKHSWSTIAPFYPDPLNLGTPYSTYLPARIDTIPCESKRNVAIVLLDWGRYIRNVDEAKAVLEAKCPDLQKTRLSNSTVYQLGKLE